MKNYKRIYNLALSIYSHIRHHDYIGARLMVIELLELLNNEIKEEESGIKVST